MVLRTRKLRVDDRPTALCWCRDAQLAAERLYPISEPAQARTVRRIGASDTVIADVEHDASAVATNPNAGGYRLGVLADVGQRLAHHVVGRHLRGSGSRSSSSTVKRTGTGARAASDS